jgi:hypothetical protein
MLGDRSLIIWLLDKLEHSWKRGFGSNSLPDETTPSYTYIYI